MEKSITYQEIFMKLTPPFTNWEEVANELDISINQVIDFYKNPLLRNLIKQHFQSEVQMLINDALHSLKYNIQQGDQKAIQFVLSNLGQSIGFNQTQKEKDSLKSKVDNKEKKTTQEIAKSILDELKEKQK